MPHVRSVNRGMPQDAEWAGTGRTSIDKQRVTSPVSVRTLGLEWVQVSDTRNHGGVDKTVYAFAREDLDFWERELGMPIRDGQFGENLTTSGLDVNESEVGERWRIGIVSDWAVLELASVRIPCNDFKNWQRRNGYDARAWVRRFTAEHRPGPYLRVVREGVLCAGDPIEVVHQPGHCVTVSTMFRARPALSRRRRTPRSRSAHCRCTRRTLRPGSWSRSRASGCSAW